jgi:hypothetical protein
VDAAAAGLTAVVNKADLGALLQHVEVLLVSPSSAGTTRA